MSLYAGLLPPGATRRARRRPFFARETPRALAKTRSWRSPVENDGAPPPPTRLTRRPAFTYTLPPVTKAMREQLPETATAVVSAEDWWRRGRDTRFVPRPSRRVTKASTLPLVSPATRFDAADRNATHFGAWRN